MENQADYVQHARSTKQKQRYIEWNSRNSRLWATKQNRITNTRYEYRHSKPQPAKKQRKRRNSKLWVRRTAKRFAREVPRHRNITAKEWRSIAKPWKTNYGQRLAHKSQNREENKKNNEGMSRRTPNQHLSKLCNNERLRNNSTQRRSVKTHSNTTITITDTSTHPTHIPASPRRADVHIRLCARSVCVCVCVFV